MSDGGASFRAARVPIVGRKRVARYLVNLAKREIPGVGLHLAEASGQPCLYLTRPDGEVKGLSRPFLLLILNWKAGIVHSVMLIRNEDKLQGFHQRWLTKKSRFGS